MYSIYVIYAEGGRLGNSCRIAEAATVAVRDFDDVTAHREAVKRAWIATEWTQIERINVISDTTRRNEIDFTR